VAIKVKLQVKIKVILNSMKTYSRKSGTSQPILNLALEGGEWSALDGALLPPTPLTAEKKPR